MHNAWSNAQPRADFIAQSQASIRICPETLHDCIHSPTLIGSEWLDRRRHEQVLDGLDSTLQIHFWNSAFLPAKVSHL
jgi:hypothetical protein